MASSAGRRRSTPAGSRTSVPGRRTSADANFILHYGDLTDATNLIRIIQETQPDEIYNLAAQSHVQVSFETPEYTANADGLGTLRLLEAIRILKLEEKTRFYQASTSPNCTGWCRKCRSARPRRSIRARPMPSPSSMPTGSRSITARPMACTPRNGILFNHESPLRGETFVTRKITRAAAAIALGRQDKLYLGNLDAKRDWGHAKDYVDGMWLMLQQDEPDDYVLATGETTTVREFVELALCRRRDPASNGGRGRRRGRASAPTPGACSIAVDPRYFRPTEVDLLIGDPSKAQPKLGWRHETNVRDLAVEMTAVD